MLFLLNISNLKYALCNLLYWTGVSFLYMAKYTENLLPKTGKPDINILLSVFFIANFLAATQDIAVDGWALTILKKWFSDKLSLSMWSKCFVILNGFSFYIGTT